eukprot:954097-Pelagomonas_calceolata.AAC.1
MTRLGPEVGVQWSYARAPDPVATGKGIRMLIRSPNACGRNELAHPMPVGLSTMKRLRLRKRTPSDSISRTWKSDGNSAYSEYEGEMLQSCTCIKHQAQGSNTVKRTYPLTHTHPHTPTHAHTPPLLPVLCAPPLSTPWQLKVRPWPQHVAIERTCEGDTGGVQVRDVTDEQPATMQRRGGEDVRQGTLQPSLADKRGGISWNRVQGCGTDEQPVTIQHRVGMEAVKSGKSEKISVCSLRWQRRMVWSVGKPPKMVKASKQAKRPLGAPVSMPKW